MIPAEIVRFVEAQQVPEGWELRARAVRKYAHRNQWAIDAVRHGRVVRTWRAYDVMGLMPYVLGFVDHEAKPVTVTTDASGHVTSIEDVA